MLIRMGRIEKLGVYKKKACSSDLRKVFGGSRFCSNFGCQINKYTLFIHLFRVSQPTSCMARFRFWEVTDIKYLMKFWGRRRRERLSKCLSFRSWRNPCKKSLWKPLWKQCLMCLTPDYIFWQAGAECKALTTAFTSSAKPSVQFLSAAGYESGC